MPLSAKTTWRGAFPTGIDLVSVFVWVLITPSVLAPLSATYRALPSVESAMPAGNQAPVASLGPVFGLHCGEVSAEPQSGIEAVWVAAPVDWSKLNLSRNVDCGTQRVLPSEEKSGPSGPTEESSAWCRGPVSRSICLTIVLLVRLKIVRLPENSFQPSAARYWPFGADRARDEPRVVVE